MLKNQAWLVTGASGYLGVELCKKIKSTLHHVHLIGTDARAPQHNWFDDFIPGSLDRPNNEVVQRVQANNVDLVIHLAGVAVEGWCFDHPLETCESNIRSVYLLLEAVRQCSSPCSFILSTTDKVYGRDATDADPYREDQPLIAKNIYETSKVCADLIAQSYWLTYQVPLAIVRFSNIYGGLDHNSSRLFPRVLERLQAGDAPELRLSATRAEYTRDFIHFSDVAEALILLAEALLNSRSDVVGEIFNISSGDERRVRDVLEEIIAVCRPGADYVEVEGGVKYLEIVNQCASNEKIRRTLNWSPKVSLANGIRMIRDAIAARRTPLREAQPVQFTGLDPPEISLASARPPRGAPPASAVMVGREKSVAPESAATS